MDYHPRILSFCEKCLSSVVSTSKTNSQTTMARHKSRRKYMKMDTFTLCFLSIIILQTLASCAAEQIFHNRDRSDLLEYNPPQHKFKVSNLAEAGNYLVLYGYVDCTVSRRKRDTMASPVLAEMNPEVEAREESLFARQEAQQCTKAQIRQGLIKFQEKWGLAVTGDLEPETLKKMNSQRCGNKDTEKKLPAGGAAHQNQASGSKKPTNTRRKRHAAEIVSENIRNRLRQRIVFKGNELTQELIDDDYAFKRRKRQLQQIKDKINSGELRPDPVNREVAQKRKRKKRSIVDEEEYVLFENEEITWQLDANGHSKKIPVVDQKAALRLAFRMWSEVCPLTFREVTDGDINTVDIVISFGKLDHGNCGKWFDGEGGANAHSWAAGDMHFDEDENWKEAPNEGVYLVAVAVHELGHVLNLNHTQLNYSVMFPYYDEYVKTSGLRFELGMEDRMAVKKNYGACKGKFDAAFDWVRVKPSGKWVYNTYFFRRNLFWMYENKSNRARYGDPLVVNEDWVNVPSDLDAVAQAIYFEGIGYEWKILTLFFKGDEYYLYDNTNDRVKEGYPRKIADDFGSKNSSHESVPDNLDAVVYDPRVSSLYFFKDQWVWIYSFRSALDERATTIRKLLFTDMFPMTSGETEVLDGYLDTAYYSHTDQMMYFIKGEVLYENILFSPFRKSGNSLKKVGNWWDKWLYICEVGKLLE